MRAGSSRKLCAGSRSRRQGAGSAATTPHRMATSNSSPFASGTVNTRVVSSAVCRRSLTSAEPATTAQRGPKPRMASASASSSPATRIGAAPATSLCSVSSPSLRPVRSRLKAMTSLASSTRPRTLRKFRVRVTSSGAGRPRSRKRSRMRERTSAQRKPLGLITCCGSPARKSPAERSAGHEAEQELHLDLRQVLRLVADQMVVEPAGRDGGQGQAAEIDLVEAPPGLEVLLPAPRHLVEPAPLSDERRRALAAEGLVLLARQQRAGRIEARALDDAADLLPRERGVGAPELALVPSRELGIVDDRARRRGPPVSAMSVR